MLIYRQLKTKESCCNNTSSRQKILFEGARAVGVEYSHKGSPKVAHATKEIIISAGALGSPQLLQISGIGPAEKLKISI